jgi:hypothetical protein
MAVSRETSRKKLAELLEAAVTEAADVKAYQPSTIGATPAIYIRSLGSDRPVMTLRGKMTMFLFDILVLVNQGDPKASPPWTEAQAEDLLDAIEAKICLVISNNAVVDGVWNRINYLHGSEVRHFDEEGIPYMLEEIPIQVEAYRDV